VTIKFPKKIRVNCFDYNIICPYKFRESEDLTAQHSFYDLEIRVSTESLLGEKKKNSKIVTSFIHELLHAIDHCYGFRMLEEDQVETLSNVLFEFFSRNLNGKKWNVLDKLDILGHKYRVELGIDFEELDDATSISENNSCIIYLASLIRKPVMQRAYLLYHAIIVLNKLVGIGIDENMVDKLVFAFIDTIDRNNLWGIFTTKD